MSFGSSAMRASKTSAAAHREYFFGSASSCRRYLVVGIKTTTFPLHVQIVGVEQSRAHQVLQIRDRQRLAPQPNEAAGAQLLQGAIHVDLGEAGSLRQIRL